MEYKQGLQEMRVVIASYDASWLRVSGNYLSEQDGIGHVDCYGRGTLLLTALKEGIAPDIIVLDEQLQDMDLLAFMQAYASLRLKRGPVIIGLCSKQYLGYTGNLIFLGMTDFMAKPIYMNVLYERIVRLYHAQDSDKVKTYCEALYQDWGIGHGESTIYLMDAVRVASDSVEKLAVRKEILWSVGVLHDCSSNAVDSSLRRLIERLEKKSTPGYLAFKERIGYANQSISVSILIYAMKEQLAQQALLQDKNEKMIVSAT